MHQNELEYWNFGFNTFGPFLNGFTSWLYKNNQEKKTDKIFFFSRDGYIMEKAFDIYEKQHNNTIPHEYVYFSRNSLRRALLWDCPTYENAIAYLSKERFVLFAEIASYFGIAQHECDSFLKETNTSWNENVLYSSIPTNKKIIHFYNQFKDIINKRSREQYENIISYFKQIGLEGNVSIVDIGWHGGMQYYLERLLEKANINSRITGFYVGIKSTYNIKGSALGYLFDSDNLKLRKRTLCFFGVSEKFFQSLEGSTDNYINKDGKIIPTLKPYEYQNDLEIQKNIKSLHEGALKFVEQFAKDSTKKSYKPLLKFGCNPTNHQVNLFKFFYTTDGEIRYFIPQKPLYRYLPKQFITDFSNSSWKTGFLKGLFKIPLPYFWIYKLLKR